MTNTSLTDHFGLVYDFPKAYPSLDLSAYFRSCPEDFVVNEELGFEPSGSGEHVVLHIEKKGQNTHWVAERLAEYCNLPAAAVGFCGRKDRHAITRQWFSLYAPKLTDINWAKFSLEGVSVLSVHRHAKKLRFGSHRANHFSIQLRDVKQNNRVLSAEQQIRIVDTLKVRLASGVPNYFGEQRFGRDQSNLLAAEAWFIQQCKPHPKRRSMVMSAARAYLFNTVLAERVRQNTWRQAIEGDVLAESFPTGPLWGRGRSVVGALSESLEKEALKSFSPWCHGLEYCGLKQERRSLVLLPQSLSVRWTGLDLDRGPQHNLQISFSLGVGTFATAILAEVADLIKVTDSTASSSL